MRVPGLAGAELAKLTAEAVESEAGRLQGAASSLDASDMATSVSAAYDGKGTSLSCLGACGRVSICAQHSRTRATYGSSHGLVVVKVELALECHGWDWWWWEEGERGGRGIEDDLRKCAKTLRHFMHKRFSRDFPRLPIGEVVAKSGTAPGIGVRGG
jgi:hypothetical protein